MGRKKKIFGLVQLESDLWDGAPCILYIGKIFRGDTTNERNCNSRFVSWDTNLSGDLRAGARVLYRSGDSHGVPGCGVVSVCYRPIDLSDFLNPKTLHTEEETHENE